ncbi:type II toxin-antitoxin system prevent-host-death family antitoxin [Crenothrix polyspora]|uniref:Antitoxin n=1 Tax=Crenothrix polyspora TaxID=360316 RepID=A0A1R4H2G6_9GAMM|nr:type II toxin-antitoxin system prevent-host-death family antitoxin [Crenothrix polyspora]SJM90442.1 hypothetical protein CRENPOLYSF1_1450003 [Crenothrix polyspora]
MRTFTATEAKQKFGELIDTARTEDITIIKNGRPFVLVSNALKEPPLPDVWEAKREIITRYFDGKINRTIAMKNGGYNLYRELLQDANYLAIPMPRLPNNEIKRMSDKLSEILGAMSVIKLIIADSGPLISLSMADALDLLLMFKPEVQVVLTDIVYHEVTAERDRYPDAQKTYQFLTKNAGHITIEETSYGQAVLFRVRSDPGYKLPPDAGEMSIASFDAYQSEASIILFEDKWFLEPRRFKSNTNLISTFAFIENVFNRNLIDKKRYTEIITVLNTVERSALNLDAKDDWKDSLQIQ